MNVLFMTHSFPRDAGDAAGSFILRLARGLAAEGVTVRVVAPSAQGLDPHATLGGIAVDRFRYAPARYETLAYGGNMAEQVRDSWTAKLALAGFLAGEWRAGREAIRSFAPDVVHAHWWFPNGVAAARVARAARVPLVTTLHGTDVRMARSIAASRPAFRHVLGRSATVTAVSRWLAEEANSLVPGTHPVVAPMPVATELFHAGLADARTTNLLFVGRLMPQKGVDILLDALVGLPPHVGLDVIGHGPDREALGVRAIALGVASRVRWHGAVRPDALEPFYQRAAALVVPSREEGLGLVAVEAQLCETPVIAFASGGLPDVIEHERTGILVPDRTAASLARAINTFFARDDAGAALGAAGRVSALAAFSPESVGRRYAEIYRNVASRNAH